MATPLFRRNFFRKTLKRSTKTILTSFVFLFFLLGNIVPAFADDTYNNYKYLFSSDQNPTKENFKAGPNTHEFSFKSFVVNKEKQTIPGMWFRFRFEFPNQKKANGAEWSWDYIAPPSDDNEEFVLRSCDLDQAGTVNLSSCIWAKIPYAENPRSLSSGWFGTFFRGATDLFSFFSGGPSGAVGQVGTNVSVALNSINTAVIFRYGDYTGPLSSDHYTSKTSQDVIATTWYDKDGDEVMIDWLKKSDQQVSLWYYAGIPRSTGNTEEVSRVEDVIKDAWKSNDPSIQKFSFNDGSYFKIDEVRVSKPASVVAAAEQQQTTQNESATDRQIEKSSLPECGIGIVGESHIVGCIARGVYYAIYWPIAWFAGLMGTLFDFFLGYSLNDASYRADFAVRGWQLVRDISNIFFIIILVWTGLQAVFDTGTSGNMKKVIAQLIFNALLINFSLFATRVIIDISNITARVFYNSIHVCDGPCQPRDEVTGNIPNLKNDAEGYKSLSTAIVASFNPQRVFDQRTLDYKNAVPASGTTAVETSSVDTSGDAYAGYFIVVTLIAAAIMFGMAMMFWKTAFMFLGRVIGLYVAMIFAPFAFLTKGNMPVVGGISKELSWSSWLKDLTNYALLAPIFVFFLYVIYSFLQSDFLKVFLQKDDTGNFFTTVIHICVPMLIVYFLIDKGVEIAKSYAGKIGNKIQEYGTKAAGLVGGVALGGGALLGGRVLGAAATKFNESRAGSWLRDKGKDSWLARRAIEGVNKASAGSYDVRQTALGKNLFKQMGVDTDPKALNALKFAGLGLGTDQRKGGYEADVKRRQEYKEKEVKLLEEKMSDDQIKKYNENQKKKYEEDVDRLAEEAMRKQFGKTKEDIKILKETNRTAYDAERAAALAANPNNVRAAIDAIEKPKEMKSVAELNSARRKAYAENLKKEGFIDSILGKVPIVGGVIGSGVRTRADKKAAKKIEETTKVEKELADIEATLKKGFQDLIALDMHQGSASFRALNATEQADIIRDGVIQSGPRKGKGMYDILTPAEKAAVDTDVKKKKDAMSTGTDDQKKKAKEEYEELEDLVKARESNKYDLKELRRILKDAKDDWVSDPTNTAYKTAYRDALKEVKKAEKHQDKFRDLNAYIKARRDKLKGEEEKK